MQAEKLTLFDLRDRFGLERSPTPIALGELPPISPEQRQRCERLRSQFNHLMERPFLEDGVKMVLVSPVLDVAGFYDAPFYLETERSMVLEVPDREEVVRGRMDVLLTRDRFWLLVIESKRLAISPYEGIPQALAYLLAAPHRPAYGLVANGTHWELLRLVGGGASRSEENLPGQPLRYEQMTLATLVPGDLERLVAWLSAVAQALRSNIARELAAESGE